MENNVKKSYFDGKVLEYIGWKLLSYLITFFSFGIASSWGECLVYRYRFSHTVYNGKRLKFEGTGKDLFINKLRWLFLTIITFSIYGWWVPTIKTNWIISNLHFEDEKLKEGDSFFEEKGIKLFWLNVLWNFLNIISVGLLIPFTMCMKLRYINRYTVINKKKLMFTGAGINLLGRYILWIVLTIITFGIYGLWLPVNILKWQNENINIKKDGEKEPINNDKSILIIIPIFFVGIIIITTLIILFVKTFSGFTFDNLFKYPINDTINGWKYCEKGYAYRDINGPQCYKYDPNITLKQCLKENGNMNNYDKYGYSCLIEKETKIKPETGKDILKDE